MMQIPMQIGSIESRPAAMRTALGVRVSPNERACAASNILNPGEGMVTFFSWNNKTSLGPIL
jgi:hypothetical protein